MKRAALLSLVLYLIGNNFLFGQTATATPTTGKFVQYTMNTPFNKSASFYLFDDGHFSIVQNPLHEHHSGGNFQASTYSVEAYDDVIPLRKSTNPGTISIASAATGSSTSMQAMNSQNIRVGQSWRAAEDNILYYIIAFRHPGNTPQPVSGQVILNLDPAIYFQNIENPITGTNTYNDWADKGQFFSSTNPSGAGGHIVWNFNNLTNNTSDIRYLYVEVYVPDEYFRSTITTTARLQLDGEVYSEVSPSSSYVFRYPHDPNNIIANYDCINAGHYDSQEIEYTVNFQNSGNWYANTIEIEVHPDVKLDPNSVQVLNSSLPVSGVSASSTGINFVINEAQLPGSNQTYPNTYTYDQTTGFIKFSICAEEMMMKDMIETDADIYFDNQPPVNTGFSYVDVNDYCPITDPCSAIDQVFLSDQPAELGHTKEKVYPNPFKGVFDVSYTVNDPLGADVQIELYSLSGKRMGEALFSGYQEAGVHTFNYDGSQLPAGVYWLNIRCGEQVKNHRIVKMN